jgi:outer membrane protein TolC
MKKTTFSLILVLSTAAYAETMLIDLPTALRLADEKNTELAIEVQQVALAELDKSAAWYQWIPTVRIGAGYAYQDGALQETKGDVSNVERNSRYLGMGSMTQPGMAATVDLSEAIYSPLAAKQRLRAAELGEESARLRIMLDVASAYYELVRATRDLEIVRLTAANAEQLAKQTADFSESGEGLLADSERAEVESLIQQQKVEFAIEREAEAGIQLVRLLRLDDGVKLDPAEHMITPLALMNYSELEVSDLVTEALSTRPEIGQNRATAAAEEARLKQEKYGIFFPKVEVGYSYGNFGGGTGTGSDFDDRRSDVYGAIYWQFDSLGLRNNNNIKQQRARLAEAKYKQEQTMVDVAAEVRIAYTELSGAQRQLDLSRRAVTSARKSYELNSERVFENQGLPLEALQSIKALAEAESLYLAVATKYNLAQLRLLSASGKGL